MDDFEEVLAVGTGYALYRDGQDRMVRQIRGLIAEAIERLELSHEGSAHDSMNVVAESRPFPPVDLGGLEVLEAWQDYIGQDALIAALQLHVESAQVRRGRVPHLLFTSDRPGTGRRAAARLLAVQKGATLIELQSPFSVEMLASAVGQLGYADILFIDDVELACAPDRPGAGALKRLIEEQEVQTSADEPEYTGELTVIASSSRPDQIPPAVADCLRRDTSGRRTPWVSSPGSASSTQARCCAWNSCRTSCSSTSRRHARILPRFGPLSSRQGSSPWSAAIPRMRRT